jgi:hypothetical protein
LIKAERALALRLLLNPYHHQCEASVGIAPRTKEHTAHINQLLFHRQSTAMCVVDDDLQAQRA